MIDIYTDVSLVSNLQRNNDLFFNTRTCNEKMTSVDTAVMQKIDHAVLKADNRIETPYGLGYITNLSTGCKTVINILKYPDIIFSVDECGANAIELLFRMRDVKFFMSYPIYVHFRDGVPCYGYSFCLSRSGKCDPDKANRNGVPPEIWTDLQHNKVIRMNGRVFTKDLIMGEARKGLKVTYTTDTRPCDNIVKFAKDSDLFICEGMYGSDDNLDNAVKNYHMTFSEAASLARDAHVEQMWLTHYSPGLVDPEKYISNATNIFKRTMCAYDTLSTVLEYQ